MRVVTRYSVGVDVVACSHQADPDRYAAERKRRATAKRVRYRELREAAAKDKRRYNTLARTWITYVRLTRNDQPRSAPITVAELCELSAISEAAFHRNFAGRPVGDEAGSGLFTLALAVVDRIADSVIREVRREVGQLEEAGTPVNNTERVTIAITRLVRYVHRYPHLFHIDGILPRELMYSLSDALADALIWNGPATLQEKADAVAVAKYHTTALIGIMRSDLGGDLPRAQYLSRVVYVMISQVVPPISASDASELPKAQQLANEVAPPLELDIAAATGYKQLTDKLDIEQMVANCIWRHQHPSSGTG